MIAVMADEMIDAAVHSQLIYFYRVVDETTGVVEVIFGGSIRLPAGDAATVTAALKTRLAIDKVQDRFF
jgi:hypothetical protein